jgi:hypothetical protein
MAEGSWFIDASTYDEEIIHPDTGEKATVTLRDMDSGAQAEIQDTLEVTIRQEQELDGGERDREELDEQDLDVRAKMGTLKLLTVERSVVSWTLPVPVTRATLRQLDPRITEMIFQRIGQRRKDRLTKGVVVSEAEEVPPTRPSLAAADDQTRAETPSSSAAAS